MSEYIVAETVVKDQDCLIDALIEIGIPKNQIEVHVTPTDLVGYANRNQGQKANVVVRKTNTGLSGDVGFEKIEGGTYRAWINDMDRNRGLGKEILKGKFRQCYAKKVLLKQVGRTHGHKLKDVTTDKNGKIKIRITVRS